MNDCQQFLISQQELEEFLIVRPYMDQSRRGMAGPEPTIAKQNIPALSMRCAKIKLALVQSVF